MGLFDGLMDVMRLNDEDYDDYEDDYEDEYEDEVEKAPRKRFFFKKTGTDDVDEEEMSYAEAPSRNRFTVRNTSRGGSSAGSSSNITPIRSKRNSPKSMEVCVIKPTGFEDSKEISETLLANRMVVLNMEGMDTGTAQRIIDFISGSCYAIDGDLQQISNCIFLVTPRTVGVTGDFTELQGLMDTFNFSGLQAAI